MRTYRVIMALVIFEVLALSCSVNSQKAKLTDAVSSRIPVGNSPSCVSIADLNNDAKPDLAICNAEGGNITLLLGDGRGGFTQAAGSPLAAGDEPSEIAVGDLNGDSRADIVTANNGDNDVTILLSK